MRKHSTQFTKEEMNYLIGRFKGVRRQDWKWSAYSQSRFIEREADLEVMNSIWTDGFTIIELHFHEKRKHKRVLIRSIRTDKEDNQVCVVFNFTTMEIHTVYLNERTNNHEEQFHSEYDADLDVIAVMKAKHSDAFIPRKKVLPRRY
ncbi:hypothetical protein CN367_11815 [Priestia megaterium]|uniref:hypothetical protein n=1 Tax=Priestia megaterium TaxID=1404 RepID=UPI000BF7FD0A|nr:hypothetical protein [Priestia megaterium]PEZ47046.1 hypothetical protein CN367_11815 [Priestia megaterium]